MKRPKKWKNKLPAAAEVLAEQMLQWAEIMAKTVGALRTGRLAELGAMPLDQWLHFYRHHVAVAEPLFVWLAEEIGLKGITYRGAMRFLNTLEDVPEEQARKLMTEPERAKAVAHLPADWQKVVEVLGKIRSGNEEVRKPSSVKNMSAKEWPLTPHVVFFVRVFIPVLALTGENVTRCLRKARQGDLDALESLLRVDKSVMFEPGIARLIHQESNSPRRARFNRIARAIAHPAPPLTPRKTKTDVLAMLAAMYSEAGGIDATELRELANRAARKKTGKAYAVDTDIPDDDAALSKAIQRTRKKLPKTFQPDTSKS